MRTYSTGKWWKKLKIYPRMTRNIARVKKLTKTTSKEKNGDDDVPEVSRETFAVIKDDVSNVK